MNPTISIFSTFDIVLNQRCTSSADQAMLLWPGHFGAFGASATSRKYQMHLASNKSKLRCTTCFKHVDSRSLSYVTLCLGLLPIFGHLSFLSIQRQDPGFQWQEDYSLNGCHSARLFLCDRRDLWALGTDTGGR